jgi:hypothetical protein
MIVLRTVAMAVNHMFPNVEAPVSRSDVLDWVDDPIDTSVTARSVPGGSKLCEPKTEVEIVGAIHLSRDKKIGKKFRLATGMPGRQPDRMAARI